jgi:tetratricopeptide (TPR) repeat protein
MSSAAMKYNPAFRAEDELVRSFVVRHTYLELILEVLRDSGGSANQHQLVVGPRGSGKTTLVRRVAAEARREKDLASKWYPVVFGEEAYSVGTPGEFWLEALFYLADQTQQQRWLKAYEELRNERDERRLRERALAQLMDFADQQGKRILLVVENLNMLLGEQLGRDSDWDIRHTLQNEPRILLLGTATSRFEEIESIDRAWFELLTIHELKPLDPSECLALWQAVSGDELGTAKIKPIRILTGGNPRLLTILAKFAAKRSFRELMDELVQLIDDHTEYFKSHLDNLPALERKVFVALLDQWDPLTAREAAQKARIDVNKASALLRRLVGRGAVEVIAENGRKKQYQAAERLYNIYYLMRRRGHPSNRVRAAVAFMTNFYEEGQPVEAGIGLAKEACGLPPLQRELHYWAYRDLVERASKHALGSKILEATPRAFFDAPDVPPPVLELYKSRAATAPIVGESKKAATAKETDGIPESEEAAREAVERDLGSPKAWTRLGLLLHEKLERFEEAEEAYRRATKLDPKYAVVWAQLGLLLHEKLHRYKEAEEAYRKATALAPQYAWAWEQLGRLLHEKLDRYDEAEDAYCKSLQLNPEAFGWARLGQLLREKLERYEEAEEAYYKATELDPAYAVVWALRGQLLHENLERYEEAEEAYRRATKLDPKDSWAWAKLGQLLHHKLERYEEAEKAYCTAIELNPKYIGAWEQLGLLRHKELKKYEEAREAYLKATEFAPEYPWAWLHLGLLLDRELEQYVAAEKAYRKATELVPEAAFGWVQLGRLLHEKLERYEEAEEAYHKATALDPASPQTWALLGQLLHENLERFDEAAEAYRKALELDPAYVQAWAFLGRLLHEKLECFEEAEEAYRKAVELNPKYVRVWVSLGLLLDEKLEQYENAEEAYRRALELQPEVAAGWATLGELLYEKLERHKEAEIAYRKATELDPENAWAWGQLGQLLHQKLERHDEAEKAYLKLYSLGSHAFAVWNLGRLWLDRGDDLTSVLDRSDKMLRQALQGSCDDWYVARMLAHSLGHQNKWQEAFKEALPFLAAVPDSERATTDATNFLIEAAAAGFAQDALELLRNSPALEALEPLEVGLRLHLGQKPRVAREIRDVGRDVAERIRKKAEASK